MAVYPEPTWTKPVYMQPDQSMFIRTPVTEMRRFNDFLVAILQQLFSEATNIKNPALQSCTYSRTPANSKLYIGRAGSVKWENASNTPAILVQRGDYSQEMLGWLPNQFNVTLGTQTVGGTQSGILHCEYRIMCCSRIGLESAEALHDEVVWHLQALASIIRQEAQLYNFVIARGQAPVKTTDQQASLPKDTFVATTVAMVDFDTKINLHTEIPW